MLLSSVTLIKPLIALVESSIVLRNEDILELDRSISEILTVLTLARFVLENSIKPLLEILLSVSVSKI